MGLSIKRNIIGKSTDYAYPNASADWNAQSLSTDNLNNSITNNGSIAFDNTVYVLGSQSALINSNGKYLEWPSASAPGTKDFFYGVWARWTRYGSGNPCYLAGFGNGSSSNTQMIIVQNPSYYSTGVVLQTTNNVTSYATSYIPTENVWHHVALSRSGTTYKVFIDGTTRGTFTISGLDFQTPFRVGSGTPWWADKNGLAYTNGNINSAHLLIGNPGFTTDFSITAPEYKIKLFGNIPGVLSIHDIPFTS